MKLFTPNLPKELGCCKHCGHTAFRSKHDNQVYFDVLDIDLPCSDSQCPFKDEAATAPTGGKDG